MRRSISLLAMTSLLTVLNLEASAEDFSMTAAKGLYGWNFQDPFFDNNTVDGRMSTIQLQHFGSWGYGENYFEVDLFQGLFLNSRGISEGSAARIYSKWASRLSVGKVIGKPKGLQFFIVQDLFVSARIDRQGDGFYANMAGAGLNFLTTPTVTIGFNIYLKKSRHSQATYQVSPFWWVPFHIGTAHFLTNGFIDLSGTDTLGLDLSSTPELLWDVGHVAFGTDFRLLVGAAFSYHHNDQLSDFAPQAEIRWIF